MNIKFQRTGGFAGLATNVELDSANLAEEQSTMLQELLAKVLPFQQPDKGNPGADFYTYKLTITDGDQEQSIEVDDGNVSDEMYALFDFLMQDDLNEKT